LKIFQTLINRLEERLQALDALPDPALWEPKGREGLDQEEAQVSEGIPAGIPAVLPAEVPADEPGLEEIEDTKQGEEVFETAPVSAIEPGEEEEGVEARPSPDGGAARATGPNEVEPASAEGAV
jgi:hypothetical protein